MSHHQQQLEALCASLARKLLVGVARAMPGKRVGMCLLLYDFGAGGFLAYAGNGDREDTIRLLREHLRVLEERTN